MAGARPINAAFLAVLRDPTVWPVMFASMAFDDGTLYMHTDLGSVTFGGHVYLGAGPLAAVQGVEEREDGSPSGVMLTLSGIDATLLYEALTQNYFDRPVIVYAGLRNLVTGAMLADPGELFVGKMDRMFIDSGDGTAVIKIAVETEMVEWDRPLNRVYSDAELQRVYSGDLGARYLADMVNRRITIGNKTLVSVAESLTSAMDA